jgi:tripartite tricarboxylate transporter family receptor
MMSFVVLSGTSAASITFSERLSQRMKDLPIFAKPELLRVVPESLRDVPRTLLVRTTGHGIARKRDRTPRGRRVVQADDWRARAPCALSRLAPMLNDLLSGQVQFAFDGIASSIGHIRAGRLRALGVGNATRVEALPDVPAIAEFVPGYEAGGTQGVDVPRKTPVEIIEKLNREINAGLADPTMRARITDLRNTPLALSPAEYGKLLAEETEKWGKVVRFAGIKPE